tara:strand:- start:1000 stop:1533 length:534 start_codon:yes stop_codon:yes gene_type:complete
MTVQPGTYSEVRLGWWASPEDRIPETAIEARPSQQIKATIPVTHYVDLKRRCRDCSRPFIFFAEEQQYWYETLHFYVGADCVRCTECRKEQRRVNGLRDRYVALTEAGPVLSDDENLELAALAQEMIELGQFGPRTIQVVRRHLNAIPVESKVRRQAIFRDVDDRSKRTLANSSSSE